MSNRCLQIFVFVIFEMSGGMPAHSASIALLVGISHYSSNNTGWDDINGVNDIRILYGRLQQEGFVIDTLTESNATAANIRNALHALSTRTKSNDTIYLHFSGHGQPMEDADGDEQDGWDETFIPIDAQMWYKQGVYEGNNHITDDELNICFNHIRRKIGEKGLLFVVFDACHSGTMSREGSDANIDDDAAVRGTYIGFSKDKEYHPLREQKPTCHYDIRQESTLSPVIILEACQAWQQNIEVLVDGKYYGPLSYAIYHQLQAESFSRTALQPEVIQGYMQEIIPSWRKQQMVIEQSAR